MQKKGIKLESRASEKVSEVTPSRMSENAFLECRENITCIQNYTKVIYYIVLYSILYFGLYLPFATGKCKSCQHIKEKGPYTRGQTLLFCCNWGGKKRKWVGNCPLVYMLKEALKWTT